MEVREEAVNWKESQVFRLTRQVSSSYGFLFYYTETVRIVVSLND